MKTKRVEKERAIKLRLDGRGIKEISQELNVAKGSVSVWCRSVILSESQLGRLRSKRPDKNYGAIANRQKRIEQIDLIRAKAKSVFNRLHINDFKRLNDIGTSLYWAEGAKRNSKAVDFTNSDSEMIKLIMKWLRKIHKVPESKFRAAIYYHSGQDEGKMKEYWHGISGVPLEQFNKSIFKKEGTGQRKNILYNGTFKVRVCDCDLLHKILATIEQLHI